MANEKWLIDAEAVRHKINAFAASVVYRGSAEMFTGKDTCNPHEYTRGYERGILDAQKIVCGQATVDAVEVVHGYWIDSYSSDHMGRIIEHSIDCSVCDSVFKDDSREVVKHWKERFKICPFCGAKMDGGDEDGNSR